MIAQVIAIELNSIEWAYIGFKELHVCRDTLVLAIVNQRDLPTELRDVQGDIILVDSIAHKRAVE